MIGSLVGPEPVFGSEPQVTAHPLDAEAVEVVQVPADAETAGTMVIAVASANDPI